MSTTNNKSKYDVVYHTGLYGDRAEAFFKWFKYQLLDQYYSTDAQYCIQDCKYYTKTMAPGHLAKIGMLMNIERAPDNEIILGWYRRLRSTKPSSFYNTSLTLITNQVYYRTTATLPSTFPSNNIPKLKRWFAVYAMKFAKENIFERHIADMIRFRNKYPESFNKIPKRWPSAFGPTDTDLDRTSDLCRSSITYQTALETNFELRDKEFLTSNGDTYTGESDDTVEMTTIALTDAEICFMSDLLLGRNVNKHKYGSVDKSQFIGTPANPFIAECEAERRQILELASIEFAKAKEDANTKAGELYRELMNKFREEASRQHDELYAKLCREATERHDKEVARAQELAETVKRLSGTDSETTDVASLAAMF